MRLVLASASTTRLRVLQQAGLDPEVAVSGVDEDVEIGLDPRSTATVLADRKATAVAPRFPAQPVLGCDSVVEVGEHVLGKPSSPEEAARWWRAMRGATVTVWTGHCVVLGDRRAAAATSARVRFGLPTDHEIERYVATDEPMGAAGAFRLDGLASAWVESVDGDPGTVHGVSVPTLRSLLATLDVEITDLWC